MQSPHWFARPSTLPLIAALALAYLAGCRDLKADPGYCATCALDGAVITSPEMTAPSQAEPAGASTPATSAGQIGPIGAGAGAGAAVSVAGATASTVAGSSAAVGSSAAGRASVPGATQAGRAAAESGTGAAANGGSQALGGNSGAGRSGTTSADPPATRDAGMDSGPMMTLPCGRECSGNYPVCDERTHNCVECTQQDTHACSGDRPACDMETNSCVTCTAEDMHACTGERPACDPNKHTCVGCVKDESCSGDKPVCDTQQQRCVTCLRSRPDSCRSGLPVCDEANQKCVECMPGATQACRDNRRMCDDQHQCVECLGPNDCGTREHPVCSPQHLCIGCQSQNDCGGRFQDTPVCDTTSQVCVGCMSDGDCHNPNQPHCNTTRHVCEQVQPPPVTPTLKTCERCENDNQCIGFENGGGAACAPASGGKVCFSAAKGSCPRPFVPQPIAGKQGMFCALPAGLSCEGSTKVGSACSAQMQCASDLQCQMNQCTYHCTLDDDRECPEGFNCQDVGGSKFCMKKN